jgi:hypothetical protein
MLFVAVLAAATTIVATASDDRPPPMLDGTVGPGFRVTLTAEGLPVRRIAPGTYRLTVLDRSGVHSFALEPLGGGFRRDLTSVRFVGRKTIRITLTRGAWKFFCSGHEPLVSGSFMVG